MEDQGIVKVKFPKETDIKSGWTIDPSFIARVRHSIPPDEDDWIPSYEEVQAVLLALECIPAGIYTSPKRQWVGLTNEEIEGIGKDDKVLLAQFHTSIKAIDEMKDPIAQTMNLVIRQQGFDFARAIEAAHGIKEES